MHLTAKLFQMNAAHRSIYQKSLRHLSNNNTENRIQKEYKTVSGSEFEEVSPGSFPIQLICYSNDKALKMLN